MQAKFLDAMKFQLMRAWYAHPRAVSACALAAMAMCVSLALRFQQEELSAQNHTTLQDLETSTRATLIAPTKTSSDTGNHVLPSFDSAHLVEMLTQTAKGAKLDIDETTLTLDDGTGQPYLRYRVSFSVTSSYPIIRRFVDDLKANVPNISLDSISCSRSDINTAPLGCDLAFSAYYRREAHEEHPQKS